MPLNKDIKKVLVIGSGPIVIGQAAEFDYAGAQACKVLKETGIEVVLVNSNPATIMTDTALADKIYLEPLTVDTITRIIEKERPDSVLPTLGGQTGLTIAMQLNKNGTLKKYGVKLLGTNAESIDKAEDRELFKQTMQEIGQPCIPSDIAFDIDHARKIADEIGYPVVIRPAFTLGGYGGGVAYDEDEFMRIATNGLEQSPIHQVLVEKYIYGWKEIEFEVMRDKAGNSIAVCSMENVDPVGVHTGDSIVVAPCLTLSNIEYQMLRKASLDIIEALKIEGGCNCQFALHPESMQYAVIEVNPRVSRSSALASKATGYPIAKVSTRIALGYTLDEIKNEVTGSTYACFEPTVDYVVVKFPKWPFDKFAGSKRTLGTQMKATGEVMAIAQSFESALMKAVRGVEISADTLNLGVYEGKDIIEGLKNVDDRRIFAVYEALSRGVSTEQIHDITKIDNFFINRIKKLVDYEKAIAKNLDADTYIQGKKMGYTDKAIARISGKKLPIHRNAVYKIVDTCAAEFAAKTPYFYSTYDDIGETDAFLHPDRETVLVLGSGPIRIGQGIEFDYSSVHCVWALKRMGYDVAIINNNPETVSTDFDVADRLYFEPLTPEDVDNIIDLEKPIGVVVAFGGQTAIKLTKHLDEKGIRVLGTSADGIDLAEDRGRFDALLESLNIRRPRSCSVMTKEEAIKSANELGYPVLVRPSYVIGGQNMTIASCDEDVDRYMDIILAQHIDNPVLVDKYLMGKELEVDVISDGKDVLIPGIMEHIERAGVHSGDSIAVYPPYNLTDNIIDEVIDCSTKLALALGTQGLVNIQYLIYDGELYVIEVNPRASRTIPYISKVTGVPMVDVAAKVMVGKTLKECGYNSGLYHIPPYFAVKVPVFSFEKLSEVNSMLGPEMKSTGEVLGLARSFEEALFKGLVSAGFNVDTKARTKGRGVYISVSDRDKDDVLNLAKKFYDMGYTIYSTPKTAEIISALGNDIVEVGSLNTENSIYPYIEAGKIDFIVNTLSGDGKYVEEHKKLRNKAIQHHISCMTSLDTANALADIIACQYHQYNTELVDIGAMRQEKQKISFTKMQATGNDYIYIDNRDEKINCPESLAIGFCNRYSGIGADGLAIIENSYIADAKVRVFNRDGTENKLAGNALRCCGKYLYDNGIVNKQIISVETSNGVKVLRISLMNKAVSYANVNMGMPKTRCVQIPVESNDATLIDSEICVAGEKYTVTSLSMGDPHAVIFCDNPDNMDVEQIGTEFEYSPLFPERVTTEFVKVINEKTLKMRVWERSNGETKSSGSGVCAAVVAAVLTGRLEKDTDIAVKTRGGDLVARYTGEGVYLTGPCMKIFEGVIER